MPERRDMLSTTKAIAMAVAIGIWGQIAWAAAPPDADSSSPASGQQGRGGSFDRDQDRISDALAAHLGQVAPNARLDVIVTFTGPRAVAVARAGIGAFAVTREFDLINGFAASMTAGQIRGLANSQSVYRIDEDFTLYAVVDSANADTGAVDARPDFDVTGLGVTACVLDTGVDPNHEQLDTRVVDFRSFVGGGEVGAENAFDDHWHGTHVAATIAGDGFPYGQFQGFAPDAEIVAGKVLNAGGSGSASGVIAGIEWCAANEQVDIISMSLGSGLSDGLDPVSQAVNCAADPNWQVANPAEHVCGGIVGEPKIMVISAGNDGARPGTIGAPGTAELAITVGAFAEWSAPIGALRQDDGIYLRSFSSRGPVFDDNGNERYMKPDIAGPGSRIAAAYANTITGYAVASGTSMATPAVAGIIALLIEAEPALANDDDGMLPVSKVRDILTESAIDWGAPGSDNEFGSGIVDAYGAVALAKGVTSYVPTFTPPRERLESEFVDDLGLDGEVISPWTHLFTVAPEEVGLPISATVTIHGDPGCVAWYTPGCPDLEAKVQYQEASGVWVDLAPVPGQNDITESLCPATGECGDAGRVEVVHFRPVQDGVYRIFVYPAYEPAYNNGQGGSFDFDFTSWVDVPWPLPMTNHAPIADDNDISTSLNTEVSVPLTGSDADGDPLTFWLVGPPDNGTLSGTEPNLTYTPAVNFTGVDSFTFRTNDGQVDSDVATVTVAVIPDSLDADFSWPANPTMDDAHISITANTSSYPSHWYTWTKNNWPGGWRNEPILLPSSGPVTNLTPKRSGNYSVTLTISDGTNSEAITKTIVVGDSADSGGGGGGGPNKPCRGKKCTN